MFRKLLSLAIVTAAVLAPFSAAAQQPPIPIESHQVNPDDSITFRYLAPHAQTVLVNSDAFLASQPMTKGADGMWTLTTAPLPPQYYSYSFKVDGITKLDPFNPITVQNSDTTLPEVYYIASKVLVPGHPPMPWELTDVPHGAVDHHYFTSHIVKGLTEDQDAYVVYTPPHYDPHRKGGYPVLYLLHGWSDVETGWANDGHANLILDSLLAAHKAVPMIVVMPLGYGDENFARHPISIWGDKALVDENLELFTKAFETEIMPTVEREYNIAKGPENHAIAGNSMGGQEALTIGLNHPEQFAWVAGLSAALIGGTFDQLIPHPKADRSKLRLLWVACGTSDGLIRLNRAFAGWAKQNGLPVTAVETPGKHTFVVWRNNLVQLAPLLFQQK
jgi:enterochelin esterase-like enzyme